MTRSHAARQLLAHGPLTFGQFADITGWPLNVCRRVLSYLVDDLGHASRMGRLYRIEHGQQLPDVPALATEERPGNGPARAGALRAGAAVDVSPTAADVRQTQAGTAGCGRAAGGVEREELTGLPTDEGQKNETPLRKQRGL